MDNEDLIKEINILKAELEKTKNELVETKEHLKKYTAPSNMKKYYQNHKEEIIKKVKEYKVKNNYKPNIDKEKRKEYNKIAKKDAPKNIGIITYIIGGILSIIGLISLFLGFTSAPSQIVGMPLKSKFV